MKITLAFLALSAFAQSTLPARLRMQKPDPARMKVGDFACIFPLGASVEHHLWFMPGDMYFMSSARLCGFSLQKTATGWRAGIGSTQIYERGHDTDLKLWGFVMVTEIAEATTNHE